MTTAQRYPNCYELMAAQLPLSNEWLTPPLPCYRLNRTALQQEGKRVAEYPELISVAIHSPTTQISIQALHASSWVYENKWNFVNVPRAAPWRDRCRYCNSSCFSWTSTILFYFDDEDFGHFGSAGSIPQVSSQGGFSILIWSLLWSRKRQTFANCICVYICYTISYLVQ